MLWWVHGNRPRPGLHATISRKSFRTPCFTSWLISCASFGQFQCLQHVPSSTRMGVGHAGDFAWASLLT